MPAVQGNQKYQTLLKTARDLFWKFGVRRVSVEEICREAGVSKMTFYKFFSNKIELAKIVLNDLTERSMKDYRAIMKEEIPYSAKVQKLMQMKFENSNDISQEFVKDIYQNESLGLKTFLEDKRSRFIEEMMKDFMMAKRNGWIRKDIRLELILYFMNKISEMAADEKLLMHYDSEQDLIMDLTNFFFYGIGVNYEKS